MVLFVTYYHVKLVNLPKKRLAYNSSFNSLTRCLSQNGLIDQNLNEYTEIDTPSLLRKTSSSRFTICLTRLCETHDFKDYFHHKLSTRSKDSVI